MLKLTEIEKLYEAVPVGEQNAKGTREIWQCLDLWSKETIRQRLNDLASHGHIERNRRPHACWTIASVF